MTSVSEVELYPHVERYLRLDFAPRLKPTLGTHLTIASVTATSGPIGAGRWSRPDLALVNLWRHKYQPQQHLEVYGFEVKRDGGCDLTSVHETLAHKRLVHFAYLVWHLKSGSFTDPLFATIKENCAAYGLGLISFSDHRDGSSFVIHLEANRGEPDDDAVDEFIETRFDEQQKKRLLSWLQDDRR